MSESKSDALPLGDIPVLECRSALDTRRIIARVRPEINPYFSLLRDIFRIHAEKIKEPSFRLTLLYVGVTYLPGQSPTKYCRRL